mgnify:CR=1 FL=1
MEYCRVYSDKLDPEKSWYAYSPSIVGFQKTNSQHACRGNVLFKSLATNIQEIDLRVVYNADGTAISVDKFGGKSKRAYAISSFGILALALRQHNLNQDLFAIEAFQRMILAVNTVALEKSAAKSTPNVKRARMSTTEIVESTKISPPEKKRRISETRVVIVDTLKKVAGMHNEDIFTVLGNIASLDEDSEICNIFQRSTDVLFSKLQPKKALKVILSEESQFALTSSIRVSDWMYLLLKIRLRISDAGWQTLLNLTHLGRTGVSIVKQPSMHY